VSEWFKPTNDDRSLLRRCDAATLRRTFALASFVRSFARQTAAVMTDDFGGGALDFRLTCVGRLLYRRPLDAFVAMIDALLAWLDLPA